MDGENGMNKISVIIPIYNTKELLEKCLESIHRQTYDNLEIICIDDGSTDGSEDIVDEFGKIDNRFVIIHEANSGESHARNVGLKRATGEYIAFCDCDDWIEPNMYSDMMKQIKEYNLDFVGSSWIKQVGEKDQIIHNNSNIPDTVFGRDELLKYIYMRDSYRGFAYMWNKLYSRDVLKCDDGSLFMFYEDLTLGADVLYLGKAALNVKRGKYISKAYYHYVQREDSGCHNLNEKKMKEWLTAYERLIDILGRNCIDQEIIDYVKRFRAYHASNAVELAIKNNNREEKKYFQEIMREHMPEYSRLNNNHPERLVRYMKLLES